jgi:hypothetical protein
MALTLLAAAVANWSFIFGAMAEFDGNLIGSVARINFCSKSLKWKWRCGAIAKTQNRPFISFCNRVGESTTGLLSSSWI